MFSNVNIPDWGEYFLDIAESVSRRSSCIKSKVGCVLVKKNRIISTGYNGAPSTRRTCLEGDICYRDLHNIEPDVSLERCLSVGSHAEINAIMHAARHGVPVEGSVAYIAKLDHCCAWCQSAILNVGVAKVVIRTTENVKLIIIPELDFNKHPLLG